MKAAKKPAEKRAFSERSQRSWVEQWKLEGELAQCGGLIRRTEEEIVKLKDIAERGVKAVSAAQYFRAPSLDEALRDIGVAERKIAAAKEHAESLRARIQALAQPSAAALAERRSRQVALARMAEERLAKDRLIGRTVEGLRKLLESRRILSERMRALAAQIDLPLSGHSLDERRFDDRADLTEAEANDILAKDRNDARPIAAADPSLEAARRDAQLVNVEVLSAVCHGDEGGKATEYAPGVHAIPYRTALQLLSLRRRELRGERTYSIPICRVSQQTGESQRRAAAR